ncbi:MAG: CHRD domain-containing protein [Acidisphaera sp.]|nr:CHRD domain-containing protein [Acidisphaera sp.]
MRGWIMPSLGAALAFAAFTLAAPMQPASAAPQSFTVPMNAGSEVPPNDSKGTGNAQLTYDPASKALSWTVTFSGLTGPATAAHFHGPAAPGANGPVTVPIGSGNVTSPASGARTLTDAQAADFTAGRWYVNVHTAAHPGGEIRGQINPPK